MRVNYLYTTIGVTCDHALLYRNGQNMNSNSDIKFSSNFCRYCDGVNIGRGLYGM